MDQICMISAKQNKHINRTNVKNGFLWTSRKLGRKEDLQKNNGVCTAVLTSSEEIGSITSPFLYFKSNKNKNWKLPISYRSLLNFGIYLILKCLLIISAYYIMYMNISIEGLKFKFLNNRSKYERHKREPMVIVYNKIWIWFIWMNNKVYFI